MVVATLLNRVFCLVCGRRTTGQFRIGQRTIEILKQSQINLIRNNCYVTSAGSEELDHGVSLPDYADSKSAGTLGKMLRSDMIVIDNFVSESEEENILHEIEPYMARLRYEYSHWDNAIHGYRETERSSWNADNTPVINRLKEKSFSNAVGEPTNFVHVLDLEENGEIKPHKDSIRFCGDTIAGVSLLSACVMRLVSVDDKDISVDLLLKPRSLYIMRNKARFDFTHEILHNDRSYFRGKRIPKGRRISLICRNLPTDKGDD